MIKIAFFAGLGLVAVGVVAIVYYVRAGIERDAALDAAAIQARQAVRDTEWDGFLADEDPLDTKWDAFWAEREHSWKLSAKGQRMAVRLVDAGDIGTWARDHAMRTAAMFAGYEHDRADAWDEWLNGHLAKLGFADVRAVDAEMDAELARGVDRMIAWTTETAAWPLIKAPVPA